MSTDARIDTLAGYVFNEMGTEVEQLNRANGWYEDERPFVADVALLHSEVSEALEAYRKWGMEDQSQQAPQTEIIGRTIAGGFIHRSFVVDPPVKPEGVASELADVLIRLIDTAKRYEIDLYAEYRRKMIYNRGRGYKHGGKLI